MGKRKSLALRSVGPPEASVPAVPTCLGFPVNCFYLLVTSLFSWALETQLFEGKAAPALWALTRFILRFFGTYCLTPVWWRDICILCLGVKRTYCFWSIFNSAASLGTSPSACRSEAQFIENFFFFFLNQKCKWGLCFWGHTTPSTSAMDSSTSQRNVLFAVVVFFLPSRTHFREMFNCAALLPLDEGHFLFHQPYPTMSSSGINPLNP